MRNNIKPLTKALKVLEEVVVEINTMESSWTKRPAINSFSRVKLISLHLLNLYRNKLQATLNSISNKFLRLSLMMKAIICSNSTVTKFKLNKLNNSTIFNFLVVWFPWTRTMLIILWPTEITELLQPITLQNINKHQLEGSSITQALTSQCLKWEAILTFNWSKILMPY
jgi:hypothetical protein